MTSSRDRNRMILLIALAAGAGIIFDSTPMAILAAAMILDLAIREAR